MFFKPLCILCLAKTDRTWCESCEKDMLTNTLRCPVCSKVSTTGTTCGGCLKHKPYYTSTQILFQYQYPLDVLIKKCKFNNRPDLVIAFANLMSKKMQATSPLPKLLIPVPLHKKRQRVRGYNQSREFAVQIGRKLNIEVAPSSLCQRKRNTLPQSTLPLNSRRKNIKGAFFLTRSSLPEHVAIVDDVITTGSTINEIALLLQKAGCKKIEAWAIARAG